MTTRACRACGYAAAVYLTTVSVATAQKDALVAPYVPTVEEDVELMLDVAQVRPTDYVIDLGSGDGRIVISAARRGALGHGVELDPELVSLARSNAEAAGVADRVAFLEGDIFDADIGAATIVTLYLFPEANLMLRPKLLAELRAGTRVVSNSFHMEDWAPDIHDMSARSSGGILLWIVPARIDGDWTLEIEDGENIGVSVQQQFQEIELASGDDRFSVDSATVAGSRIRFGLQSASATYTFDGSVEGGSMHGFVQIERAGSKTVAAWRAARQ